MKGIVIYDTAHGNTKKIAETITETLKESEIEVELFHVKEAKLTAKDHNFLVIGSPTKFGTMSFAIKFFLGKVKSEEWMNSLSQPSTPKILKTWSSHVSKIKNGAPPKRLLRNSKKRR